MHNKAIEPRSTQETTMFDWLETVLSFGQSVPRQMSPVLTCLPWKFTNRASPGLQFARRS